MSATKRRGQSRPVLANETNVLITAIRADGRHDHVTVRADRGFLYVDVDEEPVVRLEPLPGKTYGLSFHHHSGRWELTPFTGISAASQVFSPPSSGPTWTLTTFHPRRADRTTSSD